MFAALITYLVSSALNLLAKGRTSNFVWTSFIGVMTLPITYQQSEFVNLAFRLLFKRKNETQHIVKHEGEMGIAKQPKQVYFSFKFS